MINHLKLALLASVLLLGSCASVPPAPTFTEVAAVNDAHKVVYNRISVDVDADCDDGGCYISEDTLTRLMQIIANMNDEAEHRVNAYNLSLDSLSHCTYAGNQYREAIDKLDQRATKMDITHTIKQLVTFAGCGTLLWAK